MILVSTGCPASIGPEVSVRAASACRGEAWVLVGDEPTLRAAAELVGVAQGRLKVFTAEPPGKLRPGIYLRSAGPKLSRVDSKAGKPSQRAGAAQLAYVQEALSLSRQYGVPMVTAAVSKSAIAQSGAPGATSFRGHTEWLQKRDGAEAVTMCFIGKKLACSLVTTHIPLSSVARAITPQRVTRATVHLAELLRRSGVGAPRIAVCSLNPHAGEDELLGKQERERITPGVQEARKVLGRTARVVGPIGAETAFRFVASGGYDGAVAMYHDQATIPMKLVDFGSAVNVTMGLSILRTSVDHGTAYDIAWRGEADHQGMKAAMQLAARIGGG